MSERTSGGEEDSPQLLSLQAEVDNNLLPVEHEILIPVAPRSTHRLLIVDLVVVRKLFEEAERRSRSGSNGRDATGKTARDEPSSRCP